MDDIFPFYYVQSRYLALGPIFGLVLVPQVKGFWFPEVAIWAEIFEIFENLGGAGDINNSISTRNY